MRKFVPVFLLGLMLAFEAAAATLTDNVPINVPDGVSTEQVEQALLWVLDRRAWSIADRKPGEIIAVQAPRLHVVRVKITYDSKGGNISYVDSVNMDYEEHDGKREIHRNYNNWVLNLSHDVETRLQQEIEQGSIKVQR